MKMTYLNEKLIISIKISILLFCLILLVIGFMFGYIYNNYKNEACAERPLSYGIEKMNDLNNASFTCACTSISNKMINPFYFNESGVFRGTFLDSQIITIIP